MCMKLGLYPTKKKRVQMLSVLVLLHMQIVLFGERNN